MPPPTARIDDGSRDDSGARRRFFTRKRPSAGSGPGHQTHLRPADGAGVSRSGVRNGCRTPRARRTRPSRRAQPPKAAATGPGCATKSTGCLAPTSNSSTRRPAGKSARRRTSPITENFGGTTNAPSKTPFGKAGFGSEKRFSTRSGKGPQQLSWKRLYRQFGAANSEGQVAGDDDQVKNFRKDALRELRKLKLAWPTLDYATPEGCLEVRPCLPSVRPKALKN